MQGRGRQGETVSVYKDVEFPTWKGKKKPCILAFSQQKPPKVVAKRLRTTGC